MGGFVSFKGKTKQNKTWRGFSFPRRRLAYYGFSACGPGRPGAVPLPAGPLGRRTPREKLLSHVQAGDQVRAVREVPRLCALTHSALKAGEVGGGGARCDSRPRPLWGSRHPPGGTGLGRRHSPAGLPPASGELGRMLCPGTLEAVPRGQRRGGVGGRGCVFPQRLDQIISAC